LLAAAAPLWGDSEITTFTDLNFTISSLPEAKLGVTQNFVFPVLQGTGPLTMGNNLRTALTAELSPISVNGIAEFIWTPIAFFQAAAGARAGSGWNIALFGSDIKGIGINRRGPGGTAETEGSGFEGLLWSAQAGGTLQFDLAAVLPGDWHHVVFQSYHEIRYKGYTAAASGDSWYFENDDGENRNGFNYYGNFLLGYQMPLFLNTLALMAEVDKYLYDTPGRDDWGDGLGRWTFSALFNFTITERFSAALAAQFRTRRNYTDDTKDAAFYQDRRIRDNPSRHLEFYRVALIMTLRLHQGALGKSNVP
ncbi:MAG: hypothetical protein LBP93_02275, partial [Treponema sp.]|nr:hypothetical protein [Treponema sp.]